MIDATWLALILCSEFSHFRSGFDREPVSEFQELRAYFLAWCAVFLPEAFSESFVNDLKAWRRDVRMRSDYHTSCWYRCLPLDAALFALTGDLTWIDTARANIDHHNSSLRLPALESLILVVDRLAFDDPELQAPMAHNIEALQIYADWGIALLAFAQGNSAAKRAKFQDWLQQYDPIMTSALLKDLVRGAYVTNPLLWSLVWITQYVSLRLVSCGPPSWHQRSLFPVADELPSQSAVRAQQLPMFAISEGGSLEETLWRRLREHPASQAHIHLEG